MSHPIAALHRKGRLAIAQAIAQWRAAKIGRDIRHRSEIEVRPRVAFVRAEGPIDAALTKRIIESYRQSAPADIGAQSNLWSMIEAKTRGIHEALMSSDLQAVREEISHPARNKLFYGFDNTFDDFHKAASANEGVRGEQGLKIQRQLVRLAEAVGVQPRWNPEGGARYPHRQKPEQGTVEAMLDRIEDRVGIALDFPNPFPDEFGLASTRGVISERAVHAIYQAYRLRRIWPHDEARVMEIGAGLGRTAYYARKFGILNYTIVDIAMTQVAQATFLGSVLGANQISLSGETATSGVRLRSPAWLDMSDETFDVVLNVDSLTEMNRATAENYASLARKRSRRFLSINHEANEFRTQDLDALKSTAVERFPYWLREGYVEELYVSP